MTTKTMTMTAVYWTGPGEVEVRTGLAVPVPGPGQVLVENEFSLISPGTERTWLTSDTSHVVLGTTFPFSPGYSAAGRVAQVGSGVEQLSVGDTVVAEPLGAHGGHASHVLAAAEQVTAVPAGVSTMHAALFQLGRTAAHTVRLADVPLGGAAAVVGQVPIGLIATAMGGLGAHTR